MRRRIGAFCLLLCLLLSAGSAAALAEGVESLVTRSFLEGRFADELRAAAEELASRTADAPVGRDPEIFSLSEGDRMLLLEGESAVLLHGSAELSIRRGSVVNASVGFEAYSDSMNPRQRYIVCEGGELEIRATGESSLYASGSAAVTRAPSVPDPTPAVTLSSPFTDVQPGDWFHDDVVSAVQRGLVNGMSPTTFEPQGQLMTSQCVKLAACMHQLWHEGRVTLQNAAEGPWYQTYVDYARANGIIDVIWFDTVVNRDTFVGIFYRALPESAYAAINEIPDGGIPDVPLDGSLAQAPAIYAFYRAGILTGYPGDHRFWSEDGDMSITRAEVATIMNRMFDSGARVRFSTD